MASYYNEIDPFAAAWLRNLVAAGLVPAGDVDERDIRDVRPADLAGYTQAHFFAGIGGWSLALRLAGWPDDRPVWTGSCPCQPFSAAGRRGGTADERHLWPHWFHLIEVCRPPIVFGEQVEAAVAHGWLDLVFDDLEGAGYACAAAGAPACSVGAFHIRQRLWFVAYAGRERGAGWRDVPDVGRASIGNEAAGGERERLRHAADDSGAARGLADGAEPGRSAQPQRPDRADGRPAAEPGRLRASGGLADDSRPGLEGRDARPLGRECAPVERGGEAGDLGDPDTPGWSGSPERDERPEAGQQAPRRPDAQRSSPRAAVEWLPCRDGKARPTQPGLFPLLDGLSVSLARMRAVEDEALAEVVAHAERAKANPREVLRMVRDSFRTQAHRQGPAVGMRQQLSAAEVLLDLLLNTTPARDRAADDRGIEEARREAVDRIVRGVRADRGDGRSPRRWLPDEQRPEQPANSLHVLSLVLARHAEAYRALALDAHAAIARVPILRGAGNAIVPQVAAEFIRAAAEVMP